MPTKKTNTELENNVINGIAKQMANPEAKSLPDVCDIDSLQCFGSILNKSDCLRNEFVGILNRIYSRILWEKVWRNPLSFLFKESEFGYAIEEVFTNIFDPIKYDPFGDGADVWKRVLPDTRSVIHELNVKFFIKSTVYPSGLKQAFLSYESFEKFRRQVLNAASTSMELCLYEATIYIMALSFIESGGRFIKIDDFETNPKDAIKKLQIASDEFIFPSTDYNIAGVTNFTQKKDQFLFVTPTFNATENIDVLLYAFNAGKGELAGRKILVKSFADFNYNRLNEIFVGGVPKVFTDNEIEKLKKVPAFLCDRDFLILRDMDREMSSAYNQDKRYWNNVNHWWGTISFSPFANAVGVYYGQEGIPERIVNPYGSTEIKEGRDNMFYVRDAFTTGAFAPKQKVSYKVEGEALEEMEYNPGWYKVINKRGKTATITYSSTGLDDLVVNLTSV